MGIDDRNQTARSELKYIIHKFEAYKIIYFLKPFCSLDKNARNSRGYCVRSLYFDDVEDSFFYDKINGIKDRIKIRIRTYLPESRVYKLEIKEKHHDYVSKWSVPVSREYLPEIINGSFRVNADNPVLNRIISYHRLSGLRPVVLVDYWRKAFVFDQDGDPVRITIDSDISSHVNHPDLFQSGPCGHRLLRPELAILEIKFRSVFPDRLRPAIRNLRALRSAFSKYALSRKFALIPAFDV